MLQESRPAELQRASRTEHPPRFARPLGAAAGSNPTTHFAPFDPETANALSAEREGLIRRLNSQQQSIARELQIALPDWLMQSGHLGNKFTRLATTAGKAFDHSTLLSINRLVVVELALRLPETLAQRNLPSEVLALYPAASKRLVTYLQNASDPQYHYPHDSFVKDLRFASGLSVPCGAQDVDLRSTVGFRASARLLMHRPSARYVLSTLRHGQ